MVRIGVKKSFVNNLLCLYKINSKYPTAHINFSHIDLKFKYFPYKYDIYGD